MNRHTPPDVEEGREEDVMRVDNTWRVDKHIPIALILVLFMQTGGAFWWAATITARMDQIERQIIPVLPQGERLIKLETKFDSLIDAVNEVKAILRLQRTPQQ